MRKEIAVFIALMLIPTAQSVETSYLENYTVNNDIREFETTQKSEFQLNINTDRVIHLFDKEGQQKKIERSGMAAFAIDNHKINQTHYWVSGTKFPARLIVYNSEEIILEESLDYQPDGLGFTEENHIFTSGGNSISEFIDLSGKTQSSFNVDYGFETLDDGEKDGIKTITTSDGYLLTSTLHKLQSETRISNSGLGSKLIENNILAWHQNGLGLYDKNTNPIWERGEGVYTEINKLPNYNLVYGSDNSLKFRNLDGDLQQKSQPEESLDSLNYLDKNNLLVGKGDNRLFFFNEEGEKLGSEYFEGLESFKSAYYRDNGRDELALEFSNEVRILEIEQSDQNLPNQSLSTFTGMDNELLKPISQEEDVIVSRNDSFVDEVVENSSRIVSTYPNSEFASAREFNDDYNISKKKYYIDSKKKSSYITALAAEDNATVTFDSSEADRKFTNYTLEELKQVFIDEFEPNHIVVANMESEGRLLAAEMAVKDDILPVHSEYNTVIQTRELINQTFEQIGENHNTVLNGKHVSLLDAPKKDRVIDKNIFSEPVEFSSDNPYRRDRYSVGRYPSKTGYASLMYRNSQNDNQISDATVASSYLHSNWPVILSTVGGGMRSGKSVENTLEKNQVQTTRVVEYRSNPVEFLLKLTPVEIQSLLNESEDLRDMMAQFLSDSAAQALQHLFLFIKALSFAEETLEIYLEFDWSTFEFQPDRAMDRFQDFDVPEGDSYEEVIQKTVMESLYVLFWPDRLPEKTESNVISDVEDSDLFFYIGRGGGSKWILPNNDSSTIKNRYNGTNSVNQDDLDSSSRILWDSTKTNSEMVTSAILGGSSSYITYSADSYSNYNTQIIENSISGDRSLGKSITGAVNRMENQDLNPEISDSGKEITTSSLTVYGNPEQEFIGGNYNDEENSRNCHRGVCEIEVVINPDKEFVEYKDGKQVVFDSSEYLLEDFAPITPLYRYERNLPDSAEVVNTTVNTEYSQHKNIKPVYNQLLSSRGEYYNTTVDQIFPENQHSLDEDVTWLVSGMQFKDDSTKVLESAELNLKYKSPTTLELKNKDANLTAEIYSEKKRTIDISWRINGSEQHRKLNLNKGLNNFNLQEVDSGVHQVEAYLYDDEVLDSVNEEIRFAEPLQKYLFTPDISRGDTGELAVVVENPNNFPVETDLKTEVSGTAVLGLLEDDSKKITVPGKSSRSLRFEIMGLEKGNYSVSVNNLREPGEVNYANNKISEISSSSIIETLQGRGSTLDIDLSNSIARLEVSTVQGTLKIRESSEMRNLYLETDDYAISRTVTSEYIKEVLNESDGSISRTKENGVIQTEGELDKEPVLENRLETLDREVEKFESLAQR